MQKRILDSYFKIEKNHYVVSETSASIIFLFYFSIIINITCFADASIGRKALRD